MSQHISPAECASKNSPTVAGIDLAHLLVEHDPQLWAPLL
jgi:hypothetical protein